MDKAFWRAIVEKDFAVPEGHTAAAMLPELMKGLGSTDPELRDNLCLEILYSWIMAGHYDADEIRQITASLLANLRVGVGEGENDHVFLRAFSVLILQGVVKRDGRERIFTLDELDAVRQGALQYLLAETDMRGCVPDKGWAHSTAHTGDLLEALAGHPAMGAAHLESILDALAGKLLTPTTYAWLEREDYRLCRCVMTLLRREVLPVARVAAWLEQVAGTEPRYKSYVPGTDTAVHHNVRSFLAALHLLLTYQDLPEAARSELLPAARTTLKSYMHPGWL